MEPITRRRALALAALAAASACTPTGRAPTATSTPTGRATTTGPPPGTGTRRPRADEATPERSPEPTPAAQAAVVPLVCRDAWGARPPRAGMAPHQIQRLTVHHSAVAATTTAGGPAHLRGYQAFHMDSHGWPDIAYHVAVDRAGVAYELRDWGRVGDTGTSYDPAGHFLLLLDGNFDQHAVSDLQFGTAARVLAWASGHFAVGLDTITGHRDHAATSCPGDMLYRRLDELRATAAIATAAGGVTLERRCGPRVGRAVDALEDDGVVPPILRATPTAGA